MLIATPIKLTKTELKSIQAFVSERMMALRTIAFYKTNISADAVRHTEDVLFNAISSAYFAGRKAGRTPVTPRNHKLKLEKKIITPEREKQDRKMTRTVSVTYLRTRIIK